MSRSSNDDRSDRYNPNNDAYEAAEANEANQRGDYDDDDWDGNSSGQRSPDAQMMCDAKFTTQRICVFRPGERVNLGRLSPSEAEQCGSRLIDRLSHFLDMFDTLVRTSWEHAFETDESQSARQMAIDRLRRFENENPYGAVKENQWGSKEKSDLQHALDNARAELLWATTRKGGAELYRSPHFPDGSCMRVPDAQTTSLGWRELLQRLESLLKRAAEQTSKRPFSLTFSPHKKGSLAPCQSPDPGQINTQHFASDEELIRFLRDSVQQAEKSAHYSEVVRDHVLGFRAEPQATGINPSVVRTSLDALSAIRMLVSTFHDSWDIRPILTTLIHATRNAEWVEASACVFGVKYVTNEYPLVAHLNADTPYEARALHGMFRQRGFRAIVLRTPRVPREKLG